jgi:hypothetical protein
MPSSAVNMGFSKRALKVVNMGFSKRALKVETFKYGGLLCMSDLLAQSRSDWI